MLVPALGVDAIGRWARLSAFGNMIFSLILELGGWSPYQGLKVGGEAVASVAMYKVG